MNTMLRVSAFSFSLLLVPAIACADVEGDCEHNVDHDIRIRGCTQVIFENAGSKPFLAWGHVNRGIAYALKRDFDKGIADFDKATDIDPGYWPSYHNRGKVYYERREYDRAIAEFSKVIDLNPNDATPFFARGIVYRDKRVRDRAIADFRRALAIDPTHLDATNELSALGVRP